MRLLRMALENELLEQELSKDQEEWIGFDLDGTVAEYDGWQGVTHIGAPIAKTITMIKAFLAQNVKVKIFTARVATTDIEERELAKKVIANWTTEHIGKALEATCIKDRFMVRQYDDRARQVIENEGEVVLK